MEQRITKLEADTANDRKRIDHLEHAMYGNGKPGVMHDVREAKEAARYATEDINEMKTERKERSKELRGQTFALFLMLITQAFILLREIWS